MRTLLVSVSLLTLAACSGGGPQTVSSTAAPTGVTGSPSQHSFANPTEAKTYSAIGGVQSYAYSVDDRDFKGQYEQLYAGDATTARNSGISVTYDPRDAIFEVKIADSPANVTHSLRFQDPLHRTDFGGLKTPQGGTPNLNQNGIQYLQAGSSAAVTYDPTKSDTFPVGEPGDSRDVYTFFYQKPGTTTKYVTFAGYVRNSTSIVTVTTADGQQTYDKLNNVLERGAFVFGERTDNNSVPKLGTGSYSGAMIASMVYNPRPDFNPDAPTYFQWIDGTSNVNIDFAASSVKTSFAGTVTAPLLDIYTSRNFDMPANSKFAASGTGRIDLVNTGGFTGKIDNAGFTKPDGAKADLVIAGSSLDGAFYGPKGEEVGGGFRIVGGTPDERIDIVGSFTAATPK
jgi:hypothetical protein